MDVSAWPSCKLWGQKLAIAEGWHDRNVCYPLHNRFKRGSWYQLTQSCKRQKLWHNLITVHKRKCNSIDNYDLVDLPNGIQSDFFVFTIRQLWNQAQMRDLRGSPAKLEDHNKGNIVYEQGPSRCTFAVDTEVENERKRTSNTQNSDKMPHFSSAIFTIASFIGLHSNKRGGQGIGDLSDQQESSCGHVRKLDDLMKVDKKVCKPHRGTKVIKNVTNSVAYSSSPRQLWFH